MKIELDVRELVVRGLVVENPAALADAVRTELTRQLSERGVPAAIRQTTSVAKLRARPIAPPRRDGRGLGGQVARAIYGALGR